MPAYARSVTRRSVGGGLRPDFAPTCAGPAPGGRTSTRGWPPITVAIYPLTTDIARLAGKLDAEQQRRGIVVPFADLLIGATALSLGYSVLTLNARQFGRIPGLLVIQL